MNNFRKEIYFHPRCIKPNHSKVANQFDEELVQEQLRYNGILEISHIRNQGWPVRFTFEEFLQRFVIIFLKTFLFRLIRTVFFRYKFIAYPQSYPIKFNGTSCEKVLQQLKFTDYVIGKSKVNIYSDGRFRTVSF